MFIAIIWINHNHLMTFARDASPRLIWINFLHLFLVALLPFATGWMAITHPAPAPVTLYASIFVLVSGAYLIFEREIIAQSDEVKFPDHARKAAAPIPNRDGHLRDGYGRITV